MTLSKNGQKAYESALHMYDSVPGVKRPSPEDFERITDDEIEPLPVNQGVSLGSYVEPAPLDANTTAIRDHMYESNGIRNPYLEP